MYSPQNNVKRLEILDCFIEIKMKKIWITLFNHLLERPISLVEQARNRVSSFVFR
ncbi:hypothetical protein Xekj_03381 [Xenorhabdus sp. KJ12.1]|nr:hypothetical protein Xekj_03381 [Xenorhabdus sp. KJ12.1]